jgi:hypothetical protein
VSQLPQIPADLRQLLSQLNTDSPAPADLAALEEWFDRSPTLYQEIFGLSAMLRQTSLDVVTTNAVGQAAIRRETQALADALGYTHAPPLQQILIDNILACWLRCHWTELQLAACDRIPRTPAQRTAAQHAPYWEQRLSAAQRRYLHAVESLAGLHKLQRPTVQVNIGQHQVNLVNQKTE